jgi:hypothetical protein|tara:strand:+ start:229 stop:615 length:387 start_codon:yes stop_codon:yes gene_type:complete
MNYNKTWEVMNNLEEAFNKISTVEFMAEELINAVNKDDMNHVNNIANALLAYLPVYTENYDRASKRAWNNTVGEVAKVDNPYKTSRTAGVSYEDVVKYLETDTFGNYVSEPQEEKTEDSGTGINEESS